MSFYERKYSIPKGLLHAISLVETGTSYSNSRYRVPWPWTVNVDGAGRHFDTYQEAKDHVKKALKKGQRNIDVGCMQINLRAHPEAFVSIAKALDPESNVRYGAQLLKKKYIQHGSWSKAVKCYHSSPNSLKSLRYYYNVESARKEVPYGLALSSNERDQFSLAKASDPIYKPEVFEASFDRSQRKTRYNKGQIKSRRGKVRFSSLISRFIEKLSSKKGGKNSIAQRRRLVR